MHPHTDHKKRVTPRLSKEKAFVSRAGGRLFFFQKFFLPAASSFLLAHLRRSHSRSRRRCSCLCGACTSACDWSTPKRVGSTGGFCKETCIERADSVGHVVSEWARQTLDAYRGVGSVPYLAGSNLDNSFHQRLTDIGFTSSVVTGTR